MSRMVPACMLLALLGGCAQTDPYRRDGMWQPEGVNELNLVAMAARPSDLLHGHGELRPQPQLATAAVTRLLTGAPTPLPSLSADTAPGAGGSTAAAGPAAAGPAAGGQPAPAATGGTE